MRQAGPDHQDGKALEGEIAYASLAAALALGLALVAERWLGLRDLSLVFITAVIFASARTRMVVAVYAALLCFMAYNFFFLPPRHSFYIEGPEGVATALGFLAAAMVCGRLAGRFRTQLRLLRAANERANDLQRFAQSLTAAADEAGALQVATGFLREALDAEALVLPLDENTGALCDDAFARAGARFDPSLQAALARFQSRTATRVSADAGPRELSWHCLPVQLGERRLAVACLRFPQALPQWPPEQAQLLQALLHDLAQTLARARLVEQVEQVRLQGESERLRAALLSSVSHDLRSPLSTIIGSAESLDAYREQLSVEDQQALVKDIHSEGLRLDRYIQNLLDMTRVGQGALSITREWLAVDELCGSLLERLRRSHPQLRVRLELPSPRPWLQAHPALIEQALYNLLDNAAKFSPPDADILLRVERQAPWLQFDVIDAGPGIAEADRLRIFDRFYTGQSGDRAGSGLGLTICQGIARAHGGQIEALGNPSGTGAILRLRLPLVAMPTEVAREDGDG